MDHVRPYANEHYANAKALTIGAQTYRFPVTGASSGNRFSVLTTNAPDTTELGVLPHTRASPRELLLLQWQADFMSVDRIGMLIASQGGYSCGLTAETTFRLLF